MADLVNTVGTLLTNNGDIGHFGAKSTTGGIEESQESSGEKGDSSNDSSESFSGADNARAKKQDALQGKNNANKPGKSESNSSEKGQAEAEGKSTTKEGSSQSQQSLQSGQTTVQFSSGGAAGSLSSLLGLFASSVNLARADSGSLLSNMNQLNNLNSRLVSKNAAVSNGNNLVADGKILKGTVNLTIEQFSENNTSKLVLDISAGNAGRGNSIYQDNLTNLLKNIRTETENNLRVDDSISTVTVFTFGSFFTYIPAFNANTFFFSPEIIFAFPNSQTSGSILLPNGSTANTLTPFSSIISTYMNAARFSTSSTYDYEVLSPFPTLTLPSSSPTGLMLSSTNTPLTINVAEGPLTIDSTYNGLTLTPRGDLFVNVNQPLSVLINVTNPGSTIGLPVRIDVGPGQLVTNPNVNDSYSANTTLVGTTNINGQFESTVLRDSNGYTIVGSGEGLQINGSGDVSAYGTGMVHFTLPSSGIYTFPSNTIYRHVGTTIEAVPAEGAYGNFAHYNQNNVAVNNSITLPQAPAAYTLQMGGNVLDVYGTKYGIADTLNVILPTSTGASTLASLPTNTLIMGGNTLAGFGISYGDMHTLTLQANASSVLSTPLTQVPAAAGLITPTNIIFNSNLLYVDKAVNSTLFPHLQSLDIQLNTAPNTLTQMNNLHIVFNDSIIQGNVGNDIFYSDIARLGDFGNPTRYNGFISGTTISTNNNEQLVTTVTPLTLLTNTDGSQVLTGNNSITWGNNIYIGSGNNLINPDEIGMNTYDFTLLTDTMGQPVFAGHALITNFTLSMDSLIFQLTPSLFRTLDVDHNKQPITAAELDEGVAQGYIQAVALNLETLSQIPTFQSSYILSTLSPLIPLAGTIFNFAGGGSLILENLSVVDLGSPFANLNVTTQLIQTYMPVAPIAPALTHVSVYSTNPLTSTGVYYVELDNFFTNSVFATYVTTPLPAGINIDPYGSITVTNTIPFLAPITITATDQNGNHATNTILAGFLDQPTIHVPAHTAGPLSLNSSSNILEGDTGSTLIGNGIINYNVQSIGTSTSGLSQTFLSNLIVDTAGGGATGYGDLSQIAFTVQGTNAASASLGDLNNSNTFTFNPNALAITGIPNIDTNGLPVATAYGVADTLTVNVEGGRGNVSFSPFFPHNVDVSAQFSYNTFNFDTQTIYGQGTLYGDLSQISLTAQAGSLGSAPPFLFTPEMLNVSSSISYNSFNFAPTSVNVYGATSASTNVLYANVASLALYAQATYPTTIPRLSIQSTATLNNNAFTFSNSTLSGGPGTTIFYGHLATFGDPFNFTSTPTQPLQYNGFVDGVTVSTIDGIMTLTDLNNNTITWGNNTYTGGVGSDLYNFTIIKNLAGHTVMQGFDTITNFNPQTDTLVFNLEVNIFKFLGMNTTDTIQQLASKLDADVSVSNTATKTVLSFGGGGSITLDGSYPNISSLTQLVSTNPNSIQIHSQGKEYTPPVIVNQFINQFDPVFINIVQPGIFSSFITNTNPAFLTYSATNLPPGISLSPNGTLDVNVTSVPVANTAVNITASDGLNPVPFTVPIFAINASDGMIHRDTTTLVYGNVTDSQAFNTANPGNTIVGGGANILFNPSPSIYPTSSAPLVYASKLIYDVSAGPGGHTAVGDVQTIQFINNATTASTALNEQIIIFNPNMFNINASAGGGVWGNAQTAIFSATSTMNAGIPFEAEVSSNQLISGPNTLFGSGTLYGNMQSISLHASVQAAGGINSTTLINSGNPTTLNIASTIDQNIFTFDPTSISIFGDQITSTNTIYANVGSLLLTEEATFPTSLPLNVTLTLTPTLSNNAFNFSNSTLVGGLGTNIFYGHLYSFGDPYNFTLSGFTYNGFVNGVDTSVNSGMMTITDDNHNTIRWGNNTYTGGTGKNLYNFTIIEDRNGHEVMQGFDVITNFNPAKDKLVFNLVANVFSQQLSGVTVSNDGTNTTLSFAGGGSITLDGIVTDLNSLASTNSIQINQLGVSYTLIALNPTTLPNFNPFTHFNPVVIGVNKPQAFASVLANPYNPLALTYSLTTSQSSVPLKYNLTTTGFLSGVTLSPEGTLVVNSPVPTYGTATVTITDPTNHSVSFTTPIFALNATDGVIHTGTGTASLLTGNIMDSQVFETNTDKDATNTFNNTIIGGGGNTMTALGEPELTFDPIGHPTTGTPIVYGSKLIYDISIGGLGVGIGEHTAIGDVKDVQFVNNGMASGTSSPGVNGQTIIFNPNLFNINGAIFGNTETISMVAAGLATAVPTGAAQANIENNVITAGSNTILGGGTVFGNAQATTLLAAGGVNANGSIDAHIQGNTFTFGPNTVFLDNNINARFDFQGYTGSVPSTVYGNMQSLTLAVNDPATATTGTVGNGYVTGNTFTFGGNTLGGGLSSTTAYASIGALIMENNETSGFTHAGASQIANNTVTFGDTTIISRAVAQPMSFYGDIADLSQTGFITQPLTAQTVNGHVSVTDAENNTITWGNDTFIQSTNAADTFTFTLLSPMGYNLGTTTSPIGAIMQGNVTIKNFDPGLGLFAQDQFVFNLSPLLFKTITAQYGYETNYNRTITGPELFQALSLPLGNGGNAVLQFTYGSITIPDYQIQSPDTYIHANLAYSPAPITIVSTTPAPLILSKGGGYNPPANVTAGIFSSDVYGNVLDQYFNNIDIGNQGSTYTVTPIFASLPSVVSSPFSLLSGLSFDQYGTATVSSSSPGLTLVTVTPTDVHFSENTPQINLMMGTFTGNTPIDPGTGTFVGGILTASSLLQGQWANEIMAGHMLSHTLDSTSGFAMPQKGGNMIINTNPNTTAYGDFRTVAINVESPTFLSVTGHIYNFGKNYFDVTGIVFGTADNLAINVTNGVKDTIVTSSPQQNMLNAFSANTFTFGGSTIYGQGTIYGNLKSLQISATGGQNDTNPSTNHTSVAAKVDGNIFTFEGANIAILGDGPSALYPNLASLSFVTNPGTSTPNLDASATITNNHFTFGNSVIIGGNGPTNYYPGISDLTGTDFWNSEITYTPSSTSIIAKDGNGNTITWGNTTLNLGTAKDIIHANLLNATILDGTGQPILDGSGHPILDGTGLPILDGTGLPLLDEFGQPVLDEFGQSVLDGTGLPLLDEFGQPILDGTGLPILDGTGLPKVGFGTPMMEGNLTIYNFNPTLDVIRFNLSVPLYNSLSSHLTPASLTTFQTTTLTTNISAITVSVSGGNTLIQFVDPTGSGSFGRITLEGITGSYTSLTQFLATYGSAIQVGTTLVGTGSADTFTFRIPSGANNNFSTFQEYDTITQLSPTQDNLQITAPVALYNALSAYALLNETTVNNILGNAPTPTGSITITQTPAQLPSSNGVTVDSTLNFITNGAISGQITLDNVNITNLTDLGSHFQFGVEGTSSIRNIFTFGVPANSARDFSSFTDTTYITNFNPTPTHDILQFTLPVGLYNTINPYGSSTSTALVTALATAASGITVSPDSAGTGTSVNFKTNGTITGSIDLQNVELDNLSDLGSALQLGIHGTSSGDAFYFAVPVNAANSFSAFTDKTYITNFNPANDHVNITITPTLYKSLSQYDLSTPTAVENALITSAATAIGGITTSVDDAGTGTNLNFVTNGTTWGSIDLQHVTLTNLSSLGSAFQVGLYGPSASDTFTFAVPANTAHNFTSFQVATYIANFNPAQDTLQVTTPVTLYNDLSDYALRNDMTINTILTSSATSAGGITVTQTPAQFSSTNGVTVDSILNFTTNDTTSGTINLHNVDITNISNLGSHFQVGIEGTGASDTFVFFVPSNTNNNFSSFTDKSYITNFGSYFNSQTQDYIQIILPIDLYRSVSRNETYYTIDNDSDSPLEIALTASAATATGGITLTSDTNGGTNLNFVTNGTVSGSIDIQNLVKGQFPNEEFGLQFGYVDHGTAGTNATTGAIFNFIVPLRFGGGDISTFTQFDHITNFNLGVDTLQITLPEITYNLISQNKTLTGTQLTAALENNAIGFSSPFTGGVAISEVMTNSGVDTVLSFQKSGVVSGTITLDNTDIGTNPHLVDFGSSLQIGYFKQGVAGAETFKFNVTGNDYSGFKQFAHVLDFNAPQDSLEITLSQNLYKALSGDTTMNTPVTLQQLETGVSATGLNTHNSINIMSTPAEYSPSNGGPTTSGVTFDSVIQFLNNNQVYGTITLHNVNIQHLTELPHVIIGHA